VEEERLRIGDADALDLRIRADLLPRLAEVRAQYSSS